MRKSKEGTAVKAWQQTFPHFPAWSMVCLQNLFMCKKFSQASRGHCICGWVIVVINLLCVAGPFYLDSPALKPTTSIYSYWLFLSLPCPHSSWLVTLGSETCLHHLPHHYLASMSRASSSFVLMKMSSCLPSEGLGLPILKANRLSLVLP